MKTKIAVTYENGEVFQHFGHTKEFKFYTVEDKKIVDSEIVPTMGSGHSMLADFLLLNGVTVLICGGIGGGAKAALAQKGIELRGGVRGNADEKAQAYVDGTLEYNAVVECTHHHDHDHEEGYCCGHHHDHDHECDDPNCSCHHHHHHADEVFTSWGAETPKQFTQADIDRILTALDSGDYGAILRAKGIVPAADGQWLHFDYVPQEHEVRYGSADYTGRLCVIGSQLKEDGLKTLFGL